MISAIAITAILSAYPCDTIKKLAYLTMDNRQNGVDLSLMLDTANNNKVIEWVIFKAYEVPIVSQLAKEPVAVEFSNQVYLVCRKQLSSR